jgi:hypothetical protein
MVHKNTVLMPLFNRIGIGLFLTILIVGNFPCVTNAGSGDFTGFAPYMSSRSQEDLRHGEEQVEKMVCDRPKMAAWLKRGDPIWSWVAKQFAGADTGWRIYWISYPSNDLPSSCPSYCLGPAKGQSPAIYVRSDLDGESTCAYAVFELFNVRSAPELGRITLAAMNGKISKEQFVLRRANLEYEATKETICFYKHFWQPHAAELGRETFERNWHAPVDSTFEQWIAHYADHSSYPWNIYEKYYERIIAPHLTSRSPALSTSSGQANLER